MGRILWTCVLALLLTACGPDAPDGDEQGAEEPDADVRPVKAEVSRVQSSGVTDERVADLVRGNKEFAFEMYHEQAGDGNLVFSPYSISLAFSLAYAGARGETEAQMADTLRFLPQQSQHPAFNTVENRISGLGEKGSESPSPPFRLNVANSAWGQKGYRFEQAYLETLAGHYGAGLRPVDFFQPDEASEEINAWVEDETEDRIKDLVSPNVVNQNTRFVLANAVYFKASWLYSFEKPKTREGPFTLTDGSEVTAPLMQQTSYFPYAEGDGYQAIRLPYKGDAADMLIVLPEEGRFEEVEGRLDAGFLDEVDSNVRPDEFVKLTMPRFDFETDVDLIPSLRSMGVMDAFDLGAADFGGITKEGELFIGAAVHKANITVDEKGAEAAAATIVSGQESESPEPVEMTANRPFIFAITERETGTILFLGRLTDPS